MIATLLPSIAMDFMVTGMLSPSAHNSISADHASAADTTNAIAMLPELPSLLLQLPEYFPATCGSAAESEV